LPVPVILNRFLAADLVFILGILLLLIFFLEVPVVPTELHASCEARFTPKSFGPLVFDFRPTKA
jgi:hypothetical protein